MYVTPDIQNVSVTYDNYLVVNEPTSTTPTWRTYKVPTTKPSGVRVFKQKTTDVLDYLFDFSDWLGTNDTVTTATVSTQDTTLTLKDIIIYPTGVEVWVTGGTSGSTSDVTCSISTQQGRVYEVFVNVTME